MITLVDVSNRISRWHLLLGFDEVQEIWNDYHYVDRRSDDPEQFRVIGWVKGKTV